MVVSVSLLGGTAARSLAYGTHYGLCIEIVNFITNMYFKNGSNGVLYLL